MALTPAEKQRRYRERLKAGAPRLSTRSPRDRRSRPQRWHDAAAELRALQEHYRDCLDKLPDSPLRHALRRTPADHRRGRHRGPRGDRTTARLRAGHMTPATPLYTVMLPLSAVTLPPSTLTHGNVTVHKGRQPTHAPGTTSHSSSRSQGTNTGNGTPNRMWTNTGNTIPETHKNLARKHGCSDVLQHADRNPRFHRRAGLALRDPPRMGLEDREHLLVIKGSSRP